jgi:hypothetical protein
MHSFVPTWKRREVAQSALAETPSISLEARAFLNFDIIRKDALARERRTIDHR